MDKNISEIIISNRDKDLLLFANFTYRKVHESKNCSLRWHCTYYQNFHIKSVPTHL